MLSDDSTSLFDDQEVNNSFFLNRVKVQISFKPNAYINYCPALTITAPYIDLFFFGKGIIIKCSKEYAIIDYENINCSYREIKIKEDKFFNTHGYTLDSYTFLYTRIDGKADLRYNHNPKIPIIKYGKLSLEISKGLVLNLFFNDYFTGLQLYRGIMAAFYSNIDDIIKISQYESDVFGAIVDLCNNNEINQLLSYADSLADAKKYKEAGELYKKLLNTTVIQNSSLYNIITGKIKNIENMWNNEMHKLLVNADNLMKNKEYKEARIQYDKLLEAATLSHNYLYNNMAIGRLKELKNKMDLFDPSYPGPLFDIEMINRIIEDAKSYEARRDYKKAFSKYIEVKMYGNMYSSLPYINLAKIEMEKLKKLKNEN